MSFESPDGDSYTGEDERKRDSSRKREGKREKKEKGYQVFEEEDSEEEQLVLDEIKSPSKTKKERLKPTFKFPVPVRKEKAKEKEEKKDKETKQEEKEKKKEEKKKHKKDKKKIKLGHEDSAVEISEPSENENPIFSVPLAVAVDRNKSHDGIELPAIVRECIDYIEECGLAREGIYRISGVKSKVQHLKDCYNRQQPVYLYEHEPNVVASLLKQFLRDLTEPVLTTALMSKFEEASTIKNNKKKVETFARLIADLPTCNRLLLSWMIVHMTHVIDLAKENKMTLQNVSIVLSPTMQISHRVLNVLFSNVTVLFGDVLLRKYVPPLKPAHSKWTLELPDNATALEEELAKQESLLNQLHADLNSGRKDPVIEEQLWEVQRVVTQLKRKIKMAKKNVEMGERRRTNVDSKRLSTASIPSLSAPEELQLDLRPAPDTCPVNATTVVAVVEKQPDEKQFDEKTDIKAETYTEPKKGVKFVESTKKNRAPQIGEAKKLEDENVSDKTQEEDNELSEIKDETEVPGAIPVIREKKEIIDNEEEALKKGGDVTEEINIETEAGKTNAAKKIIPEKHLEMKGEKESDRVKIEGQIKEEKETQETNSIETGQEPVQEVQADLRQEEVSSLTKEVINEDVKQKEENAPSTEDTQNVGKMSGETVEAHQQPHPPSSQVDNRPAQVDNQPRSTATDIKNQPVPAVAEIKNQPVSAVAEIKNQPVPAVAETKNQPVPAVAEIKNQPVPAVVEIKNQPVPAVAEIKNQPVPAVAEIKNQPKPTVLEFRNQPKPAVSETKNQPKQAVAEVENQTKPVKVEYEYRKAPNPPFMSTALLKPMKAEIPKPKRPEEDVEALRENIRKSEELRVLEEELLGEKNANLDNGVEDVQEDVDIDQMLDEEYALKLEEEELLAIGDELRQKIATERSEMERLNQEIQELQYLRQDSDLEDLSSSSCSSDESEDEEDLQELVSQLIQDNEQLEMSNADLCQKIHEERMICLSVKLQIRLLQQKQLESSYG